MLSSAAGTLQSSGAGQAGLQVGIFLLTYPLSGRLSSGKRTDLLGAQARLRDGVKHQLIPRLSRSEKLACGVYC